MSDKLDMALDDIIKSKRGSSRGGGGGRRGGPGGRGGRGGRGRPSSFRGTRPMSNGAGRSGMTAGRWSHDMYQGGGGGGGGGPRSNPMPGGPIKVNISNLDFGVSDSDIKELFQEFGDMRSATVHYDRSGRSLGSAEVVFGRYTDAIKAVKQYNGVHLDGRPMKIYVEEEKSGSRGDPGSRPMVKRLNQGGSGGSGVRRGRGGSRGGRGSGGGGSQKEKPKTAEELDAELDSYVSEAQKSK